MLRLLDVSLARGVRVLYSHASLIASDGERVGLIGPNGCGKSTLFAAVLGEIPTEAGEIERPAEERIAHVAQDIEAVDQSAIHFVLSGHAPLEAAKKALKAHFLAFGSETSAFEREWADRIAAFSVDERKALLALVKKSLRTR